MKLPSHHCAIVTRPLVSAPVVLLVTIGDAEVKLSSDHVRFLILGLRNALRPPVGHFYTVVNYHFFVHVSKFIQWAIEPRRVARCSSACKASGQGHLAVSSFRCPAEARHPASKLAKFPFRRTTRIRRS